MTERDEEIRQLINSYENVLGDIDIGALDETAARLLIRRRDGLKRMLGSGVASHAASPSLDEIKRAAIKSALAETGGNLSETARRLGIYRTTLQRMMTRYGMR